MNYDAQVITNAVVYAGIGNWLVAKIKNSELIPFINKNTPWLNRSVALATATLGAVGIAFTYTWNPTDGIFSLAVSGLSLSTILAGFKQIAFQYILQQTGYHVVTKEEYR